MAGGRQREFDKNQALDKAMRVFWKKGFVGASLTDLTQSMGINKPSMYATFGNKEQLFIQATQSYIENYASTHAHKLYQKNTSVKTRLKNYMMSVLSSQCNEDNPKGCYVSLCVTEAAGEDMPQQALCKVNEVKDLAENALIEFFKNEQKLNQIDPCLNSKDLAQFIVTILHGLAAMARAGKTKNQLEAVVDQSLLCL